MLGGDIGRLVGASDQAVRRSGVDDPAPALLPHRREARRVVWNTAVRLMREDRLPFLGREVLDRRDELDAGIVDQDVGRGELMAAAA